MPSFLNKVFGYRKHDDKELPRPTREPSDTHLLDGKYEAILPPSSQEDRDLGFSLFRRGVSQKALQKHPDTAPHLTLQLPSKDSSRASALVFEANPDSQITLDDATIAAKRLDPLEACLLLRPCTRAITECGLETLGIMHPNWFSASPDVQRKLISLFIRSLPQSQTSTLSPPPPPTSSASAAFENELHFTRSPHDVAAVLHWCLRHLALENGHFGKDTSEWEWYNTFFHAERNASHPPKGFSELLLPQLPPSHVELLTTTLGLISSFASHAETNGISGSKLAKSLGLWLLTASRAEQSDDWNRFYARWERAGRILEHLFLARLREESFEQRLPTRLQELVKHYPYNKGSPAPDDDLLSRPRFSTRQYDALFVRVETVLKDNAVLPRQHPIQLLLEAFQLPIDDLIGDEHLALWNSLKMTVFDEAVSSDPEGPQFTRIFVDETIHLLSLIPPDSSMSTSPALFTSPISPRKRSFSFSKSLEPALRKSNTDESTPVSPTSPSSIVVTDWAQFSLSGFGDTPAAQPLAALLSQDDDDDVEVTRPFFSRKLSQRGKSHSRRQRSREREPSPPNPALSIVETKLASVHVVQIDEAFIDFWSDAIVDPISSSWPTFVVCGLKQIQGAEQPIRWLVIEQAYSHQQQSSRVPSPEGRRGRSPRPSFKSDISGFRINSVFSSARKRFSLFSKSATDLKSGAKTPVAGELGEMVVEEETAPTFANHHVDENATVRATVSSGVIPDVTDRLNVDGISPAPARTQESDPIQAAAKEPSIEPAPQSGGSCNGSSVPTVRVPEEAAVGQDSPPTSDAKVDNSADPATMIAPPPADTSELQSICDPVVLASGPTSSAENPVADQVEIQAARLRQGLADEAEEHDGKPADRDERLHAKSTAESFNVVAENGSRDGGHKGAVAMPSTLETVAVVEASPLAQHPIVAAVDDKAPEPIVEEPIVTNQPSQKASADPAAALAVDSVHRRQIDDLSPASATQVIATETGAPLEPHSITSVASSTTEAKEVAELAEIPTPAPEHVALVQETPGREISVDACGCAGAVQVPASKPEALDGTAVSQPVAADTLKAEALSVTLPVEASSAEDVPVLDQVETEHTADHAPELAAEEAQPHVQDGLVLTADGTVDAVPASSVSASLRVEDAATVEVEAHATPESVVHEDAIIETGASTLPSDPLVGETPDPEIAAKTHKAAQAITSGAEKVEDGADDHAVEDLAEPETLLPSVEQVPSLDDAELPTQVHDMRPAAEALSTGSNPNVAIAALATVAEAIAVTAETQFLVPESAPAEEDTLGITDAEPVEDNTTEREEEETRVLAKDTAALLSASEPVPITSVTHDARAPIEIEQPSTESPSQSADEDDDDAAAIVLGSGPEEIATVEVEAQLGSEVVDDGSRTESAELCEPETCVPEPDSVEASAPVPIVDDVQEAEGS